jgi:hypothetical protein
MVRSSLTDFGSVFSQMPSNAASWPMIEDDPNLGALIRKEAMRLSPACT